ncbi:MAG: hypothetical protein P0Y49_06110 [Candidatus Pedobacter colombiensis]|uniref:Transposase n=1 Tax=Candidatus Pedobacter colombiensis TaxID=3121371 RepID=A0AAJ5WBS8_9SPHI|nr:hypothetical protein [Pedobacter sp.]WEK20710.1 MAG: hypothetical protein P0Y49_06110 [Pedobacter sp.]
MDSTLLSLIVPEGLSDYFEFDRAATIDGSTYIYLIEKNIHPQEFSGDHLLSKGFYDEASVRDFPLRGKPCFLNLKRRKWLNTRTSKIVSRDWQLVAEGTKMTQEFAFFFERLFGFHPNKL